MEKEKKLRRLIAGVVVISLVIGSCIGYRVIAEGKGEEEFAAVENTEIVGEDGSRFSEEGTTQMGTISQKPEFSVSAVTMTVEEVYKAAGDTVNAGDELMKLSKESMTEAESYYENAVAEAERNLALAQSRLQTGDLEAQSVLQETKTDAGTAADSYQAAVDEIDVKVAEKKEAYDEAVASIQQYQSDLDNGIYYTKNGLSEKKDVVTQAETELASAQAALAIAAEEADTAALTVGSNLTELKQGIEENKDNTSLQELVETAISNFEKQQTTAKALNDAQKTADTAQSKLEQAQKNFDNAVEAYNTDTDEANRKITELTEQLDGLLAEYEEAERSAVVEKTELKNQYDTAVLEGNYADSTYQSAVSSLESAVEEAQEALDDLLEEQKAFQNLEDGVIKATQDGTLACVSYEAGDTLTEDTALVIYSDTDTIMISVEVPQEQISTVAVGQEVEVRISGNRNGNVTGKVAAIASSATTGGSISNVTYAVTVSVDNTEGQFTSGSSAVVIFGSTSEETEQKSTEALSMETEESEEN